MPSVILVAKLCEDKLAGNENTIYATCVVMFGCQSKTFMVHVFTTQVETLNTVAVSSSNSGKFDATFTSNIHSDAISANKC